MVYIGKTYNLWYLVINEMEDMCEYYEHDKKNVGFTNKKLIFFLSLKFSLCLLLKIILVIF